MAKKKKKAKKGKKAAVVEAPDSDDDDEAVAVARAESESEDESSDESSGEETGKNANRAADAAKYAAGKGMVCVAGVFEWKKCFGVVKEELPLALCRAFSTLQPAYGKCSASCPPLGRDDFLPADDFDKLLKAQSLSVLLWAITVAVHIVLTVIGGVEAFPWGALGMWFWSTLTYFWCISICKQFKVCLGRKCGILMFTLFSAWNFGFLVYECAGLFYYIFSDAENFHIATVALYFLNLIVYWPVVYHAIICAAALGWNCIAGGAAGASGAATGAALDAVVVVGKAKKMEEDAKAEEGAKKTKKKKKKKKKKGDA